MTIKFDKRQNDDGGGSLFADISVNVAETRSNNGGTGNAPNVEEDTSNTVGNAPGGTIDISTTPASSTTTISVPSASTPASNDAGSTNSQQSGTPLNGQSDDNIPMIACVIGGSIAVFGMVFVIVYLCIKRRKSNSSARFVRAKNIEEEEEEAGYVGDDDTAIDTLSKNNNKRNMIDTRNSIGGDDGRTESFKSATQPYSYQPQKPRAIETDLETTASMDTADSPLLRATTESSHNSHILPSQSDGILGKGQVIEPIRYATQRGTPIQPESLTVDDAQEIASAFRKSMERLP